MSGISVLGLTSSCDHGSVAKNGTTFSGKKMKYVFHYSQHAGLTGDDYLTPTQRAQKEVRRLKSLLHQTHKDLVQKDSVIIGLTKEMDEFRLYKSSLSPSDESSISSDPLNVNSEMTGSSTDSELGYSTDSKDSEMFSENFAHSSFKDSRPETVDSCVSTDIQYEDLMADYERRIQELVKSHENESQIQRQKHIDDVEDMVQLSAGINKRYWDMVPNLKNAEDRIKELESHLKDAMKKNEEQDEKCKQSYLQGKEAAKIEREQHIMQLSQHLPSRIFLPEMMQQLEINKTDLENIKDLGYSSKSNSSMPMLSAKEAVNLWVLGAKKATHKQLLEAKNKEVDPDIILQFLKTAIYDFLTDKENSQGHLKSIQCVVGFTPKEVQNIENAWNL